MEGRGINSETKREIRMAKFLISEIQLIIPNYCYSLNYNLIKTSIIKTPLDIEEKFSGIIPLGGNKLGAFEFINKTKDKTLKHFLKDF